MGTTLIAVVLARGVGRRMKAVTRRSAFGLTPEQETAADAGLKAMMPMGDGTVAGRPFLDYALSALADAGFRQVLLVIGPDHHHVRAYYEGPGRPQRIAITFVVQAEPLGTADAVRTVGSHVGNQDFVVVNGDNLYPVEALRALRDLEGPGLAAFDRETLVASSGIPADRVAAFALVEVAPGGTLVDVIEKPGREALDTAGPHALVSMNCWRFSSQIFEACADVPVSSRGEFELTDAARLATARGVMFRVIPVFGPVVDLSRREDVATVVACLAGLDAHP